MEIKEALKFIFLNAGKINKLSDDFFVPATQLLVIYNIYLKKEDNEIYHTRICQLCEQVEETIKELENE